MYLTLTLLSTLAASLIWGVNTLFLLDAGLSAAGAFTVNAFFTAGQVVFEIPTGVVADTRGRRASYLLGAATLLVATLLYVWMWQVEAGLLGWALASILIGLGFTFFSGAVEAWLVDALDANDYDGELETIFARGQVVAGFAMLIGSVAGGFLAQLTNLGVPYLVRAVLLAAVFVVAFFAMRDEGFTPLRGRGPRDELKTVLSASLDNGWRNPPIRWVMLAAPFTAGAGIFAFYAMQPYLLDLYGDDTAFGIAGLAAAIVAGAQVLGGLLVPQIRKVLKRRTDALMGAVVVSAAVLAALGFTSSFWVALALISVWALTFAAAGPIRQAYVNGLIPSEQRATVLSFDALMSSTGGVATQPALGRAADVWSFGTSYVISAAVTAVALPFYRLARRERASSDPIQLSPDAG
jgi:MFS family permease